MKKDLKSGNCRPGHLKHLPVFLTLIVSSQGNEENKKDDKAMGTLRKIAGTRDITKSFLTCFQEGLS